MVVNALYMTQPTYLVTLGTLTWTYTRIGVACGPLESDRVSTGHALGSTALLYWTLPVHEEHLDKIC